MKIHLYSDVHLESNLLGYRRILEATTGDHSKDICVLAGDIGNNRCRPRYLDFITELCKRFKFVILVFGNHEHYNSHKESIVDFICGIKIPNFIYLQNASVIIDGYRFLGTTLWTRISEKSDIKTMNDFRLIPGMDRKMYQSLHQEAIDWLKSELESPAPTSVIKTIVITHHLPTYKLIDKKYLGYYSNEFYASDLDDFISSHDIDLWLCGHSHTANHLTIGKTEVYLNPLGYTGEDTKFNASCSIELNSI